jgi:hypothetical protein
VEEKESTLRGKRGKYASEVQSQSTDQVVLKLSTMTLWSSYDTSDLGQLLFIFVHKDSILSLIGHAAVHQSTPLNVV